jgi:hypothetical protein
MAFFCLLLLGFGDIVIGSLTMRYTHNHMRRRHMIANAVAATCVRALHVQAAGLNLTSLRLCFCHNKATACHQFAQTHNCPISHRKPRNHSDVN